MPSSLRPPACGGRAEGGGVGAARVVANHRSTEASSVGAELQTAEVLLGGKPIVRGRRLAVEHVLGMLAAGDTIETILEGYPWLASLV